MLKSGKVWGIGWLHGVWAFADAVVLLFARDFGMVGYDVMWPLEGCEMTGLWLLASGSAGWLAALVAGPELLDAVLGSPRAGLAVRVWCEQTAGEVRAVVLLGACARS